MDMEIFISNEPSIPLEVLSESLQVPKTRTSKPLTSSEVDENEKKYGKNVIATRERVTWYSILFSAVFHPFNILLVVLATASGFMRDFNATGIMLVMVFISTLIRFIQELKSANEAHGLNKLVSNTATVLRYLPVAEANDDTESIATMSSIQAQILSPTDSTIRIELTTKEILFEHVVPGDWVKLSAGDLIPADCLIIESKDLYVSQSSLTGEAIPVEKFANPEMNPPGDEMMVSIPDEHPPVIFSQTTNTEQSWKTGFCNFFRRVFGLRVERLSDLNTSIKLEMDKPDLCFLGTSVVSGTATVVVRYTGNETFFGRMALELGKHRPSNPFQLGVRRISWIFFLTMICLVPPIFILQGCIHASDNWAEAALFALSVAVGLTPEMLPMIVSSTLARGAYLMSKRKCIVKNLDSIINLGGMDVLCTDKTGTLTQNRVSLTYHFDCDGNPTLLPILLAVLNSSFQSGLSNLMDTAIIDYFRERFTSSKKKVPQVTKNFVKMGEIPFDFVRRRMSVLLKMSSEPYQNLLVTKGAVDEMLAGCTHVYVEDQGNGSSPGRTDQMFPLKSISTAELNQEMTQKLQTMNDNLNTNGFRVIAIAFRIFDETPESLHVSDEEGMTFAGFLAFQDPPKPSTFSAIQTLIQNNLTVKVLTGDSPVVCQKICEDIKLPVTGIVTTTDLDGKSDDEICRLAESGTIFAKLTPLQKAQVVRALKYNDHVVGFLGDGINDANALVEADIGISVDNGTDIARDSADIILLQKDLNILVDGVVFGRQTYGNTLKYIVMAVSSNFGNAFSLLVASAWFPFTPMLPIQMLTQNLLYDISQTVIPWDNMDPEFLVIPHRWSMKSVLRFMIFLGPWSSVFDVATFAFLYFSEGIKTKKDNVTLFHTTWFLVGILTQLFVVQMLRTQKIPFIQSMASIQVLCMTALIMAVSISMPFTPVVNSAFKFTPPPIRIGILISVTILCYCITTQVTKIIYMKLFKRWY